MKQNFDPNLQETIDKKRVLSIFATIFTLVENESFFAFDLFSMAFGLETQLYCELFALLHHLKPKDLQFGLGENCISEDENGNHLIYGFEPLIKILEENGAPFVRTYIEKHLNIEDAGPLFMAFIDQKELNQEAKILKEKIYAQTTLQENYF